MGMLSNPSRIVPAEGQFIEKAAEILLEASLASFPTETVYGLGGLAASAEAISALFSLKGRPSSNPLIVHLATTEQIGDVATVDSPLIRGRVEHLYRLMPGPLSLVLPARKDRTVPAVRAGGDTVAVRIPHHPVAQALLTRVGRPIAAPSANRSTRVSPTRASHVLDEFPFAGLIILDGGPCDVGLESTVVDLTPAVPIILRPGSITKGALEAALGEPVVSLTERVSSAKNHQIAKSPGLSTIHYSPRTPFFLKHQWAELCEKPLKIGWISLSQDDTPPISAAETRILSARGDLEEAASQLYAVLRELDEYGLEAIVVGEIPGHGVGEAILDRLRRASGR